MKIIVSQKEARMIEDVLVLLPTAMTNGFKNDIKPVKLENGDWELNIAPEYISASADFFTSSAFNFGAILMAAKAFGEKCERISKVLNYEKDLEDKHNAEQTENAHAA